MSDDPWFARLREGLFKDPATNHRKRMGEALWLYGYLHICADLETGQLYRNYKTISDESGIPESTVRKMMEKLKKIPAHGVEPYIRVRQLSRTLYIQITKWVPPKIWERVPKSGHPKNSEGVHIRENGCPSVERVPKSGHPLNSGNNGSKPSRVSIDGHSNKTPITRPNKRESISLNKSSDSKSIDGKKTNPDIKIAVDHYHDEFYKIHGFKPTINGAAVKTFQRLLKDDGIGIDELKELIPGYLSLNDDYVRNRGYPVELLPKKINALRLHKKQPASEFVY